MAVTSPDPKKAFPAKGGKSSTPKGSPWPAKSKNKPSARAKVAPDPKLWHRVPKGQAMSLPREIQRKLSGLSDRQLMVHFAEGFALLAGTAVALAAFQCTVDWWLDLAWMVRFILLLGDFALIGWITWRYVIQPWRNRLTLEQAALRAEKEFPSFRSSLISAVELAKAKPACDQGNLALVEKLLKDVTYAVGRHDLGKAVKTDRLRKYAVGSLAGVVLGLGVLAFMWPRTPILLKRLFLSMAPLPTQTIVVAITEDLHVQKGSTVVLSAKAEGVIPQHGRVEISYADKTQEYAVSASPTEPGVFSLALQNAQQDFSYRFYLHDGRGLPFGVTVQLPPVMETATFEQQYPAYTGLPPAQHTAGDLNLLAGSILKIRGRSNQNLQSARLQFEGAEDSSPMQVSGREINGELQVPSEGLTGFTLRLVNSNGVESLDNTLYRVEVIPDKPPQVTMDGATAPSAADRETVTLEVAQGLRFTVLDDYRTENVSIAYEIQRATPEGQAPAPAEGEASNPEAASAEKAAEHGKLPLVMPGPGTGTLAFQTEFKLTDIQPPLMVGDSVTFMVEALDNNNVTGPGIGRSNPRSLEIVSPEEKRKEILERLRRNAEAMDDLSRMQEEVRKGVGDLIKQ
jgi:hypothetical protein